MRLADPTVLKMFAFVGPEETCTFWTRDGYIRADNRKRHNAEKESA
jgi:hypothetical protein